MLHYQLVLMDGHFDLFCDRTDFSRQLSIAVPGKLIPVILRSPSIQACPDRYDSSAKSRELFPFTALVPVIIESQSQPPVTAHGNRDANHSPATPNSLTTERRRRQNMVDSRDTSMVKRTSPAARSPLGTATPRILRSISEFHRKICCSLYFTACCSEKHTAVMAIAENTREISDG